jgi:Sulfatase
MISTFLGVSRVNKGRFVCRFAFGIPSGLIASLFVAQVAQAQAKKPNILIIFGDDVGQTDISAYSLGVMGFHTPNIDRIAKEGMMFTDYYAENSCTAGRSTFITGQATWRTGLSKVEVPGAPQGLQHGTSRLRRRSSRSASLRVSSARTTLVTGTNSCRPITASMSFFGNLYHLNAEEEPERPYWFSNNPAFLKSYNPRGVIHSFADGKIEDTGPLNVKRMQTVDDETTQSCADFIYKTGKGWNAVLYLDELYAHACVHPRPARIRGQSRDGQGLLFMPMACGRWIRTSASC